VCPLTISLIVCRLILIAEQTTILFIVRFILVVLAFVWSTFGKHLSHMYIVYLLLITFMI